MDAPGTFSQLDWPSSRAVEWTGRASELWAELLDRLPSLPVARAWPHGEVRRRVTRDIPAAPLGDDEIFDRLREIVLDCSVYPSHPRFMGYISGPGTVPGAVGDLLASALNQNLGGWRLSPAATEIELSLVQWFAGRFGLPEGAGGVLTSGGAMANFTCLKAARDRAMPGVRDRGVRFFAPAAIYATAETHDVVRRAADMLGLGMDALHRVGTDEQLRMRPGALRDAIARDRAAGIRPLAVVASAGTVATGAVDPLADIAGVCAAERVWMHVDASYGGPAVLSPALAPLLAGIERADSIAFDPHKWMYTPIPGGCALFRRIADAKDSFHVPASYTVEDVEATGTTFDFGSHGPQWSRPFWGLKIWLSLLAFGTDAYARRIEHDVELARYAAARVGATDDLELVCPPSLSICCFRYAPDPRLSDEELDRLNERVMTDVQLGGRAYCSNAIVRGRFVLRACVVNYRTEAGDVDALLDEVRRAGAAALARMRAVSRSSA